MRLLIFISSMACGGAERVTANLANYWAGQGWDITIVTLAPRTLDHYPLHPAIHRVALNLVGESSNLLIGLWKNLRRIAALRRVLCHCDANIALGMMTEANVLLALASWGLLARMPSHQRRALRVFGSEHIHPPKSPLSPLWEMLRCRSYKRLHGVAALTSESAAWLKAHTSARRVSVIPNAVPWPLPVHEPQIAPASVCRPGRKILLAVGRLAPQKGFDLLITVFADLARKHPDWDLVILGEGPLRAALEAQIQAAGLMQHVHLPGAVGNVGVWYESASLYVMSSRFEGFGNTLAEALAYGLPAVSFDCDTGPRDIVRHGIDGLLAPDGDAIALTAALDRLMGDAALRAHFAARASEARDRFSLQCIARLWEEFFGDAAK